MNINGSLDLTNLRSITGGDAALEAELFGAFLDSSRKCMKELRKACASGDEDIWRRQAHAFKGVSLGLGALRLGKLCKRAQDNPAAPPNLKRRMLAAIGQELAQVERQLKNPGPPGNT
jgi:HPt (histidine-containing phosphotransfer) domain-containing protein